MRIASFNVENMFCRPKALNTAGWATGTQKDVLAAYAALAELFQKHKYSTADREHILKLLDTLGVAQSDESEWAFRRRSPGQLLRRPVARRESSRPDTGHGLAEVR
jgi:hypothetical protein